MSSAFTEEDQRAALAQYQNAEAVLGWVNERFGEAATIASSFSVEDVVLIDLASRFAPKVRVFTLDTGRLNPETHEVMEVVKNRYSLTIETYAPDGAAVERLTREKGHFSFRKSLENRHECCAVRKLEPLARALQGKAAWLTGLRREQSPTRDGVLLIERDAAHGGMAKVNPIAAWTEAEVWAYVQERGLPYNRLHDQGFRSIGCAPCTRALKPYESIRAGRWWWEQPDQKECGLHARR